MGTITRSFANNLTTSGLLKPTAFNNSSFNSVTSVPDGSVASGALNFITSTTASSSASIEFTSNFNSTYKEYIFWFKNMHPGTDQTAFQFQVSTDGGSTYGVNTVGTFFQAYNRRGDGANTFTYNETWDNDNTTSFNSLSVSSNVDSYSACSGFLHFFDPSNTTHVKHYYARTNDDAQTTGDPLSQNCNNTGYINTTSAINAIKFQYSSGNIDDGQIIMFGVS